MLKLIKPSLAMILSCGIILLTAANLSAQIAEHSSASQAQAGFYSVKIGDFEVIAVSDGTIPINLNELLTNVKPGEVDRLSARAYQTATEVASVNTYLIKTDNKLILVDAGAGELYGPTLGHIAESLKKIGYKPEDINVVLITHIHTDHTGGLMDGNRMVFPNATLYISKPEVDFWMNDENRKKLPKRFSHWFTEAELKVGPYLKAGKVKTFGYGKELFPGITPIPAAGHTPGHTFYSLESKGQRLVFMGDIIHAGAVQFPDPDVTITFDVDPKKAATTRKVAFADAAKNGYWVAADHVSFPGIGHLRAEGKGYLWIPINYSTIGSGQ